MCYYIVMTKETRKWMFAASTLMAIALLGSIFVVTAVADMSFLATVGVVQAVVTLVAIGLGGVFAYYKLDLFRDFQPHLTITQEVSHRRVGDRYVHISVKARLVNTSKVIVEIEESLYRIQQIKPISDQVVERKYSEYSNSTDDINYIQWDTITQLIHRWGQGEFAIEPGQSEIEVYEFIIPSEIETVLVYAEFSGGAPKGNDGLGPTWTVTDVYDIE